MRSVTKATQKCPHPIQLTLAEIGHVPKSNHTSFPNWRAGNTGRIVQRGRRGRTMAATHSALTGLSASTATALGVFLAGRLYRAWQSSVVFPQTRRRPRTTSTRHVLCVVSLTGIRRIIPVTSHERGDALSDVPSIAPASTASNASRKRSRALPRADDHAIEIATLYALSAPLSTMCMFSWRWPWNGKSTHSCAQTFAIFVKGHVSCLTGLGSRSCRKRSVRF